MSKTNQSKRVVFYLSQDDKNLLENHSSVYDVSISFYVRNCVLDRINKPIISPQKKSIEVNRYVNQLLAIGNNLNQIARKLNTGKELLLLDQEKLSGEMKKLSNHILKIQSKL